MSDQKRALEQRWVATWVAAGPALEKVREREIRASITADGFRTFAGFVRQSLITHPPVPTSGLVEQQRWFQRAARR